MYARIEAVFSLHLQTALFYHFEVLLGYKSIQDSITLGCTKLDSPSTDLNITLFFEKIFKMSSLPWWAFTGPVVLPRLSYVEVMKVDYYTLNYDDGFQGWNLRLGSLSMLIAENDELYT